MATAQQLVDLSSQLTDVVKTINAIVALQDLPYDTDTANLSNFALRLSAHANAIGQAGLAALANDVQQSIGALTNQVKAANTFLDDVKDAKKALTIVGALLTAAGSVATSLATGNIGGAAGAIGTLATNIRAALQSSAA